MPQAPGNDAATSARRPCQVSPCQVSLCQVSCARPLMPGPCASGNLLSPGWHRAPSCCPPPLPPERGSWLRTLAPPLAPTLALSLARDRPNLAPTSAPGGARPRPLTRCSPHSSVLRGQIAAHSYLFIVPCLSAQVTGTRPFVPCLFPSTWRVMALAKRLPEGREANGSEGRAPSARLFQVALSGPVTA